MLIGPPCEACANLDVNKAYDLFLTKYKQTYDDSFPVINNNNIDNF